MESSYQEKKKKIDEWNLQNNNKSANGKNQEHPRKYNFRRSAN